MSSAPENTIPPSPDGFAAASSDRHPEKTKTGYGKSLFALALGAFGIGTSEYVIMGLLPSLSRDLDVSIASAGLLVSGYAMGVVVGAPIVALLIANMVRRSALLLLMSLFVAGNMVCAIAPGYTILMIARVLTAFIHGAFFGTAAVMAADLVPPAKRAQALSLVFMGMTIANVAGVPAGALLGQETSWRMTFWAVCAIGLGALAIMYFCVPGTRHMRSGSLLSEFVVLRRREVIVTMIISLLVSASMFSVYTFIAPMLEARAGLTEHQVTVALMVFGLGVTVGNLSGGRLADWKLLPSVIGLLVAMSVVLLIFTLTSHSFIAALVTLFVWGAMTYALVPPLQYRVTQYAIDAPNMASTLNQGAFNLGNAVGAWLGGIVIATPLSYAALPWLGAFLGGVGLIFALVLRRMPEPAAVVHQPGAIRAGAH